MKLTLLYPPMALTHTFFSETLPFSEYVNNKDCYVYFFTSQGLPKFDLNNLFTTIVTAENCFHKN